MAKKPKAKAAPDSRDAQELVQIAVSKLIPYARNSRTHSEEQVAQIAGSIAAFGFINPVLMDEKNVLIAGHGRLLAAQKLNLKTVPAIILRGLSETEKRALVLADNRIALNAGWDYEMVRLELEALAGDGFDVDLLGFDDGEFPDPETGTEGLTDPDDVPPIASVAVTVPGDVWLLGNHRLHCGDSTDAGSVAIVMNGNKADLCFTSPPYGAGNTAKLRDHYERGAESRKSFYDNHDDNPVEWLDLMRRWYSAAVDVCGLVVCNVQMLADNKVAMIQWLHDARDALCDVIVWDKGHGAPQMQSNVMNNAFEFLFILGGNGSRSIPMADFHGDVQNIIRISPKGKNEFAESHAATMPVDLALWVMKTLCTKSNSIYDPFCGTGTTIIAAEQCGRKCYAVELSPKYCDISVRRWQEFTGLDAVLEDGGKTFAKIETKRAPA